MMTQHGLVKVTSVTSEETPPTETDSATFSPSIFGGPGKLLAGLFLVAAMTAGGAAGVVPVAAFPDRREDITAEATTEPTEADRKLVTHIRNLFESGAFEFFKDGMESGFSRELLEVVAKKGRAAIQAIASYIFSGAAKPDIVSEALRWLSDLNDPKTEAQRWALLERTLHERSPKVRDGAILGFAALNDPRALSLLAEAKKSERIPELRGLIDKVIHQLNETHGAAAPHGSTESLV